MVVTATATRARRRSPRDDDGAGAPSKGLPAGSETAGPEGTQLSRACPPVRMPCVGVFHPYAPGRSNANGLPAPKPARRLQEVLGPLLYVIDPRTSTPSLQAVRVAYGRRFVE